MGAVAGADLHVLEAILSPVPQRVRLHHVAQSGRVLAAEEQGKALQITYLESFHVSGRQSCTIRQLKYDTRLLMRGGPVHLEWKA